MKIRRATEQDIQGIFLLNQAFGYAYPLEATAEKLRAAVSDPGQCVLVAEEADGVLSGYIHLENYDTLYFPHMKNILGLIVLPEYRKGGIASALLAEAEDWAKATGAAGIRLDSGAERAPAHACYRKAGYTERKLHKNFRKLF